MRNRRPFALNGSHFGGAAAAGDAFDALELSSAMPSQVATISCGGPAHRLPVGECAENTSVTFLEQALISQSTANDNVYFGVRR